MSTQLALPHPASASPVPTQILPRYRQLPPIFHTVLIQAELRHRRGGISDEIFAAQLARLSAEELEPRGLELIIRRLACGTTRFLVKTKATGKICDMIDCPAGVERLVNVDDAPQPVILSLRRTSDFLPFFTNLEGDGSELTRSATL